MDGFSLLFSVGMLLLTAAGQVIAVVAIRRKDQARDEDKQAALEERFDERLSAAEERLAGLLRTFAGKTEDRLRAVERELADFKADAASRFATQAFVREMEARVLGPINELVKRVDRLFEHPARPRPAS